MTDDAWAATPTAWTPRSPNYRGRGYQHPNQKELHRWRCLWCKGELPGGLLLYCRRECAESSRAEVAEKRAGKAVA